MDESNGARFNSSSGSFGTTYLSESPAGAFLETFIRDPGILGYSQADVNARRLAFIEFSKDLCLVKCYGNGLKINGFTASITGTDNGEYQASQAVSESWYHNSSVDGVAYMSRLDNTIRCVALYDRANAKVRVADKMDWLQFSGFHSIVRTYQLFEID